MNPSTCLKDSKERLINRQGRYLKGGAHSIRNCYVPVSLNTLRLSDLHYFGLLLKHVQVPDSELDQGLAFNSVSKF